MNMREHILSALREQFNQWEEYLAGLNESQITAPLLETDWSIKDIIAHLMAWQQRSIARTEAALYGRAPEFPVWITDVDPQAESSPDRINAWLYAHYLDEPWSKVHQDWQTGFLRFLESSRAISERDLLDYDRYSWMAGYSLADVILSSYVHHQEHYEKLAR